MEQNLLLLVKANVEMVALELELIQAAEGKWYDAGWREGGGKGVFRQGGKFASPSAGSSATEATSKIASGIDKTFEGTVAACKEVSQEQGEKIKNFFFSPQMKKIHEQVNSSLKKESEVAQKAFSETLNKLKTTFFSTKKNLGDSTQEGIELAKSKLDSTDSSDTAAGIMTAIGMTCAVAGIIAYGILSESNGNMERVGNEIAKITKDTGKDVMFFDLPKDVQQDIFDAFKEPAIRLAGRGLGLAGGVALTFMGMRTLVESGTIQWEAKHKKMLNKVKDSIKEVTD